jgi:Carboxypeptidase regulatory-like domain
MRVLLLVLALASTQNSPPGGIKGQVLRTGTSDPVPRAKVILNTIPANVPRVVSTDDTGHFEFRDVVEGRYQLLATHDGFVRSEFGQHGLGSALQDVVLTLTPTGAISGRIWNRFSEPFANVAVRALRVTWNAGKPVLTAVQATRTNDLGEYRLYFLEPGPYLVSALPPLGPQTQGGESGGRFVTARVETLPGNAAGMNASTVGPSWVFTTARQLTRQGFLSAADTGETYAPLFFPGVSDPSTAVTIRVEPGAFANAVDFNLAPVRAVSLRGQVLNAVNGQPQRGVAVMLRSAGNGADGVPIDHYGTVSETGAFEFRGVTPGLYDLVASTGRLPNGIPEIPAGFAGGAAIDRAAVRAAQANTSEARLAGRAAVQVGTIDVENVALSLRPGLTVNGKITLEGRSVAESDSLTAGIVVQLQPDPRDIVPQNHPRDRVQTASAPATVGRGGAFSVTGVFAGTYQVAILNAARLPRQAYVKSARFGNLDALNPRLRIDDSSEATLEIVIGTNPGALDVTAVDEKQMSTQAATIALLPVAPHLQRYDLYRSGIADESGHARFADVVPGDYTAYVVADARSGEWFSADFVSRHEGRGVPVHIDEGGSHTVTVKVIAAGAGP